MQTKTTIEVDCERDDLSVKLRIIDAENLDADLIELSIATLLWLLIAEVRARIPDLPRRDRSMFDKGTAHAGGLFGTQRNAAPTFVVKVIHLFRDDFGGLAHAQKDTEVFEHRRDDVAEPSTFDDVSKHLLKRSPTSRFRGEDVAGAGARVIRRHAPRLVRFDV